MKVLITGIAGFVGSHFAEFFLKNKDIEVYGVERWKAGTENIAHLMDRIRFYGECDINDIVSMRNILKKIRPNFIIHLAAQSFVPTSWTAPAETIKTNMIGEVNLFEACLSLNLNPRVIIAGSSEEYGLVKKNELPIKETNPLRPLSPYAVSKVGQDMLGYQYYKSYGLNVIMARAFNHSVSKWTPVIIKDDNSGLIDIRYISELRDKYKVGGYKSGKFLGDVQLWDLRKYNLSVWSNNQWSKLKEVSCHPIRDNKLIRIITKQGFLEATDNHSIIGEDLKAKELRILRKGDRVATVNYPTAEKMYVHEEAAWLLGFFAAEGCITNGKIRIDNNDKGLLEKSRLILLKHFGQDSCYKNNEGTIRLSVRKPEKFANWLYPQVYASDKNKRIPQSILNAQKKAKYAFLQGYNEGDGLRKGHGVYEFKNFKTKSRILAAGLSYLIKQTSEQDININFEARNAGYISLNLNSNIKEHKNWGKHLKGRDGVIKELTGISYLDEVWDFSTEDEMFHAGLGNLLAHNTGPRRGEYFICSNFAKQIALIEKGKHRPVIYVGNLKARRDFTDVRDMVRAYWLVMQKGKPGEVYNISSGKAYSMKRMLNILLSLSKVKIKVKQDPSRMRPSDVPVLLGDSSKMRKLTGWKPTIPFKKTLQDLLDYWRDKV